MRQWLALALAGSIGLLAAAQSSPSSHSDEEKPAASSTFAGLRSQWALNLHDKKIEASMAEYAPDAEFIDPSGARASGTAALRHLFETVTATYDSDLTFTSKRIAQSDYLAYDSGTYEETLNVRATGKVQHAAGSYLTVYQRGKDGQWLIVQQMWTGTVN
jgi:ketosteroid isomerase-like protein